MPKPILKKASLLLLTSVCLVTVIINSCKKDSHTEIQNTISDPAIIQAKTWYESNYPINNTKLSSQATAGNKDLSQLIKPDWGHAANYMRYNDDVVEMPLTITSTKLDFGLKNESGDQAYKANYSHSSFLLLKHDGQYKAYIMTIIADSGYLNNDRTKLGKIKYNKLDSDFSGVVVYNTPKGVFINAWIYKRGSVTAKIAPNSALTSTETQSRNKTVQGLKTNGVITTTVCTPWYQTVTINGVTGNPVYLGDQCVTRSIIVTDSGNPSNGLPINALPDEGASGGGGGSAPPGSGTPGTIPPGCPGADGGVQQPVDVIAPSCDVIVTNTTPGSFIVPNMDIIDSLSNKYPCTRALIDALPNLNSNVARLIYQAFDSKDGNNLIFLEGDAAYFAANKQEDGHTEFDNDNGLLTNRIYINPAVLANSSNEYRLVTLYHEAIHAFLNSEHATLTNAAFAAKYPMINVVQRPNFSQVVIQDKYDYYIDPAYQTKVVGKDHLTMADYFITGLKDAILAYNPNFPPERALALAQAGIIQTSGPIFVNYNNMERDVTKGTSVGTKCTP